MENIKGHITAGTKENPLNIKQWEALQQAAFSLKDVGVDIMIAKCFVNALPEYNQE